MSIYLTFRMLVKVEINDCKSFCPRVGVNERKDPSSLYIYILLTGPGQFKQLANFAVSLFFTWFKYSMPFVNYICNFSNYSLQVHAYIKASQGTWHALYSGIFPSII